MSGKKHVMTVFGTRPEAVKMAPVIKKLEEDPFFDVSVAVTSQHREMLRQMLNLFRIKPDYDLNIMTPGQSLHHVLSECISRFETILRNEKPDIVLVHGDTVSTAGAALAAVLMKIRVGHVEAGLRSNDRRNPFPEEYCREVVDRVSDICFAPLNENKRNLIRENISEEKIFVTGNTVVDALGGVLRENPFPENRILKDTARKRKVLITLHRRENLGYPAENVFRGIKRLSAEYPEIYFFYPLHPNPSIQESARKELSGKNNIILLDALSYTDFVWLMKESSLCFTDSGGVQEEAPSLGVPVLVLRNKTERPQVLRAGLAELIGTGEDSVYDWGKKLLSDRESRITHLPIVNPFGDGKSSSRILESLKYFYGERKTRPGEWRIKRRYSQSC